MNKLLYYLTIGISILTAFPAAAELPVLERTSWEGYFIGIKDQKFQFGFLPNGDGELAPVNNRGEKISKNNNIEIEFKIIETAPDGKTVTKQIKQSSLTSATPATKKLSEPIIIKGKVTGDAAFQIIITPGKKSFSLTGEITDKGSLKHPLIFLISAKCTPYPNQSYTDKDSLKKFERKIRREEMRLELLSGETEKIHFTEKINLADKFPDGLKHIELETEAYGGTEFEFSASGKSKIIFASKYKNYLWNSFTLHWIPDPTAPLEAQAFTIGRN